MFIVSVIRALRKRRVRHALVGGYAVALHGAVRGTVDVDLVLALDRNAWQRAERALADIGLKPRLPVTATEVFDFRREYIANRNLTAWAFVNPDNPLEMVDILITEDLDAMDTVTRRAFGMNLRVASLRDLIAMKRKAGRPQDIEDIRALEKLS